MFPLPGTVAWAEVHALPLSSGDLPWLIKGDMLPCSQNFPGKQQVTQIQGIVSAYPGLFSAHPGKIDWVWYNIEISVE